MIVLSVAESEVFMAGETPVAILRAKGGRASVAIASVPAESVEDLRRFAQRERRKVDGNDTVSKKSGWGRA